MVETKQAPHIHTLFNGKQTGPDIKKISDPNLHWHEVMTEKTSTDSYGENHTHDFQGDTTSAPLNISSDDDNDDSNEGNDMSKAHEVVGINLENEDGIEYKYFGGEVEEVKEEAVNGVPVGIVKGYIAAWSVDRGNDRFVKGAFSESLIEMRAKDRQIRFKDNHSQLIGGFPIDRAFEDDLGLFVVGHINLEVQQGREAFSLAKQGVLSDFSVGFSVNEFEMDGGIRIIHKATLWEGSIVGEPMNVDATITEVKAIIPFQDLKVSERNRTWDSAAAAARIREFTKSDENPTAEYKKAFVWFDAAKSDQFAAYKLPIADVINGRMTVVPKAIFSAAAALQGARGGVDLPETDRPKVIQHIERYYAKMDLDSPFDDKQYFVSDDVKKWTVRDVEKFLKSTGAMSKNATRIIASRMNKKEDADKKDIDKPPSGKSVSLNNVLDELKSIRL